MQCDCKLSLKCRLRPKLSSCLKIAQKKKAFHYFPQGSLSFQTFIHDSRGVLVKHTDLGIGEVIYEIISQNIPPSGIFPLKGIDFLFLRQYIGHILNYIVHQTMLQLKPQSAF